MKLRHVVCSCLLMLAWIPALAGAAEVTATLDRDHVQLGETVTLNVRVDGDTGDVATPDLRALAPDFQVLSTSQNSSLSVINGRASSALIFGVVLRPRHTGTLHIPALSVAGGRTAPLQLEVAAPDPAAAAATHQDVFMESQVEPAQGYAGQQLTYAVRLYYAGRIGGDAPDIAADRWRGGQPARQGPQLRHRARRPQLPRAGALLGEKALGRDFALDIVVYRGAGSYVCGEASALITSIESKRGYPRNRPPRLTVRGLFQKPTVINNVESLANITGIIRMGAEEFRKVGTAKSPGTQLVSISGHIAKPGVYEVEYGYPWAKFLDEDCGGMLRGATMKCVVPGGISTKVLTRAEIEPLNLSHESVNPAGSGLGSGGMIVIAEGTCMVRLLQVLLRFYHHESCGQCTPCREGMGWMHKIIDRIVAGEGVPEDIERLYAISHANDGTTICGMGDAAGFAPVGILNKYSMAANSPTCAPPSLAPACGSATPPRPARTTSGRHRGRGGALRQGGRHHPKPRPGDRGGPRPDLPDQGGGRPEPLGARPGGGDG